MHLQTNINYIMVARLQWALTCNHIAAFVVDDDVIRCNNVMDVLGWMRVIVCAHLTDCRVLIKNYKFYRGWYFTPTLMSSQSVLTFGLSNFVSTIRYNSNLCVNNT